MHGARRKAFPFLPLWDWRTVLFELSNFLIDPSPTFYLLTSSMDSVPTTGGACIEAAPVLEVTEETSEDSPRSLTSLVQGGTWEARKRWGLTKIKGDSGPSKGVLPLVGPRFCGTAASLASHDR